MSQTRLVRTRRPLVLVACAIPVLLSCAPEPAPQADDLVDRIIAEDAAKAAAAQPDENTYPDLRDVPPRPQLGYSVEQRRAIESGLVADRDYARRSSELLRSTDGADLPPPPESPSVLPVTEAPAAVPAVRKAPPKVVLIERRDTSGDLSSFLDDVVGVDTQVDTTVEPSLVPSPRTTPSNQLPLAGDVPGGEDVPEPASETPSGGDVSASALTPQEVDPPSPDMVQAAVADQAATAGEALEVGRIWLFPLEAGADSPTAKAMAPMLAAVSAEGAMDERRLSVVGRSADPEQASRRARSLEADLVAAGVSSGQIEVGTDSSTPGEVVTIRVLSGRD